RGVAKSKVRVWRLSFCSRVKSLSISPTGQLQVLRKTEGDHPAPWIEWELLRHPIIQEGREWPPWLRVPDGSSRCCNSPRSSATSPRPAASGAPTAAESF